MCSLTKWFVYEYTTYKTSLMKYTQLLNTGLLLYVVEVEVEEGKFTVGWSLEGLMPSIGLIQRQQSLRKDQSQGTAC